jgi:hypothetical protein
VSPRRLSRATCPWTLRAWFNEYGVLRRVALGEIIASVREDRPVRDPQSSGLPSGSRRQIIEYIERTGGRRIALAQQTVCRHNRIIRSGFPDPKARFTATDVQHAKINHPDSDDYACDDLCASERARNGALQAASEPYRQGCDSCQP